MAPNISRAIQSYTAELEKKQDDEPGMQTGPVIGIGENDTQDAAPGIGENDTALEHDTQDDSDSPVLNPDTTDNKNQAAELVQCQK